MVRHSGSTPPAIMTVAMPCRIRSPAKPTAVAPEEQAVMKDVFGPMRPRREAMWSAEAAP